MSKLTKNGAAHCVTIVLILQMLETPLRQQQIDSQLEFKEHEEL